MRVLSAGNPGVLQFGYANSPGPRWLPPGCERWWCSERDVGRLASAQFRSGCSGTAQAASLGLVPVMVHEYVYSGLIVVELDSSCVVTCPVISDYHAHFWTSYVQGQTSPV